MALLKVMQGPWIDQRMAICEAAMFGHTWIISLPGREDPLVEPLAQTELRYRRPPLEALRIVLRARLTTREQDITY